LFSLVLVSLRKRDGKKVESVCIIVNYNTIRHLVPCLNSIYSQTRNIDFEVIVVDNNSQDESVKGIRRILYNYSLNS